MTLILSTVCKDGICVCADKRNVRPNSAPQDNLYKIHSFKEIPLIIYNHGVNKFNGKEWDKYCFEYEKLEKWTGFNFGGICRDFKKFIEDDIYQELKKNYEAGRLIEYTSSGLVFCGKTNGDDTLQIFELFWSYNSNNLQLEEKPHGKIVLTGLGSKYLKDYLARNKNIFTNEYWGNLDTTQAGEELKKLFLEAVKEKNKLNGGEFSDNFDLICKAV